jgi:hypothetical protein
MKKVNAKIGAFFSMVLFQFEMNKTSEMGNITVGASNSPGHEE